MPGGDTGDRGGRRLPYEEIEDPRFQQRWLEARKLTWEQVETAFRHGLDSRDRFAERPFEEVEAYLRESWEGMGAPAPWDEVAGIIRSGYERYQPVGYGLAIDQQDEALAHFPDEETIGGTRIGGVMGDRPMLGAAEPVADFDGEGGPPVGGHELPEGEAPGAGAPGVSE